ncbi:unnamed protein product [Amoebophrya sp. A120]|nr:unnamed protein product [Amoebophrya sp. A120]|eukprot:GSA120T00003633001.1
MQNNMSNFNYGDFLASCEEELLNADSIDVSLDRVSQVTVGTSKASSSVSRVRLHVSSRRNSVVSTTVSESLDVRYRTALLEDDECGSESEDEEEIGQRSSRYVTVAAAGTTVCARSSAAENNDDGGTTSAIASRDANASMRLENLTLTPSLLPVFAAYIGTAVKSLASSLPAPALTAINQLPMKVSGFSPTDFDATVVGHELQTHVGLLSLASSVGFIGSLRGLNNMKTAKQGNYMGMAATAMGILSVLASPGFGAHYGRFLACFLAAGGVGYTVAESVAMEEMPQLVAGFHSFVGLAAALVGFANHFDGGAITGLQLLEEYLGVGIGALTFTGSVVAAGKLHGSISGAPVILDQRWTLNGMAFAASALMGLLYIQGGGHTTYLVLNALAWAGLGVNMVMPVGGADMPVVVSLLNSFSGIATSAAGFMLRNDLLTITGALVASSGALLSSIMCKGINRSLANVLLGGFGTDGSSVPSGGASGSGGPQGQHREMSHDACAQALCEAKRIVIVPGYGLAVARAQQKLQELVSTLRAMKKTVHFAIHPVAGRLPGHMNVLLAEANVPYEIVREMDEINDVITSYDVAIVIGANDIVNPATVSDTSSPIYGMPAIEIWKIPRCIVLKRSMATGYSGVENPLFYLDNVRMLFGDARASTEQLVTMVNEKKQNHQGSKTQPEPESEEETLEFLNRDEEKNFPEPNKVLGILKENAADGKEKRVSVTPNVIPKLRKLGFKLVMESGAGEQSNYPNSSYVEKGVEVLQSRDEVFKQANVVLQVSEPLPEDLQKLSKSQICVSIWGMYGKESIIEQTRANPTRPTLFNMALIPRISRAQALDVLTSMANIAGYRAVLDAFRFFPKFAKPSTTASGNTPPAKVFIVGAGVAGLSAIATAHGLGAKVFASDVRSAAKEQVESMGAEFVEVQGMIQGEGAGGYARDMGEEFKERQKQLYAKMCKECDIVVTTALIPGRAAPVVVTEEMVLSMKRGSVIVDLAALNGGNCELTQKDEEVVSENGVTIIGKTNYPSEMAPQASDFLARNFYAFLDVLCNSDPTHQLKRLNMEDQVIRDSVVVYEGALMYPPPKQPEPVQPKAAAAVMNNASELANAEMNNAAETLPPGMLMTVLDWIGEHSEELAMFLGTGFLLAVGLGTNIPPEEITHLGYFVLSLMIGNFTVASVTPALHTPLISVTNAISGIIVIGGMLQLGGPLLSAKVASAMLAIFFSSVNIVGGFAVTARMLNMFRSETSNPPSRQASRQ